MPDQPTPKILIVESNPLIADFLRVQSLEPMGFIVQQASDITGALEAVKSFRPHLIIADLNLSGLTGKDLLIALNHQGIETPVIGLTQHGMEKDIIQSFRLGAVDHLIWPVRETEVISAVERALKQAFGRAEREAFARQLQGINQEMENRVRELTTLFGIGKAVTAITEQNVLFEQIVNGSLSALQADIGWLLLLDPVKERLLLSAQRNLPPEQQKASWRDVFTSSILQKAQPRAESGSRLAELGLGHLGRAAVGTPIMVQKQVAGLMVCMRREDRPFTQSQMDLLAAIADYASIAIMNARLVHALEDRAKSLKGVIEATQRREKTRNDALTDLNKGVHSQLEFSLNMLESLLAGKTGRLDPNLRNNLIILRNQLLAIKQSVAVASLPENQPRINLPVVDLVSAARRSMMRFQRECDQSNLRMSLDLAGGIVNALGDPNYIDQVYDGLLSNSVHFTRPGGRITIRIERGDGLAKVSIQDTGVGIHPNQMAHLFDTHPNQSREQPATPSMYLHLGQIYAMVQAQGGQLVAESKPGQGSIFTFTLQAQD